MKTLKPLLALSLACVGLASAAVGSITGTVTDNGVPIKHSKVVFVQDGISHTPVSSETIAGVVVTRHYFFGAAITLPPTIAGVFSIQPDRKGHYGHYGLPPGTYRAALIVDGKVVEEISGISVSERQSTPLDFDVSRDPH